MKFRDTEVPMSGEIDEADKRILGDQVRLEFALAAWRKVQTMCEAS